ncbi:MAG TPA: hypothetical protein VE890_15700 [Thermoguttaceae bacterium]|nr:hypothetical protein [Thermoguttaceae bacterium]
MADETEDVVSWGEMQAEMRRLAWTTGDFTVVPYGILWGSVAYDTERTNPGPYTLYVHSAEIEGEDGFNIDTRRTRAGLNIGGPRISMFHCAKSGGKLEIDFHGAFATENKPGVLLRHAYGEIYNDDFKLLAGQTWDVIAPLNPHVLNYSVGWGGGNIGYRRAQVRGERYVAMGHDSLLTMQASINQNVFIDDTADIDGEPSGWPIIEGRIAWTCKNTSRVHGPVTLGMSGHIGEQAFDGLGFDDAVRRTWSLNTDIKIPITQRFGFQGEYFVGENLGTFLGGVVQGINRVDGRSIRSTGGWFEFWYDLTPRFHTYAGYGIDDPRDADVAPTGRTYNHFAFATATYDVTKKLNVGMEVSSWKTLYPTLRPGEAVRIEFAGKYSF